MATKRQLEQAVKATMTAYEMWMQADGVFPDPEYDRFQDAMSELADVAGIDQLALIEQCRTTLDREGRGQ